MGWILDCRDATRLISRELEEPLPRGRRLLLRAHLLWCDPCRAFVAQVRLLRAAMQRYRS
jgi:putative zinc finger protein